MTKHNQTIFLIFLLSFVLCLFSYAFARQYWVSPTGNDTTGDGSWAAPWQHINYAIQQIGVNDTIPQRILNVMPGTYSPSATGEVFPITMVGNLWLKGTDSSNTILDAEQTSNVISCWQTKNVKISDLTIQKGIFNIPSVSGVGGISCKDGAKAEIMRCVIQYCSSGGIFVANSSLQYKDSITQVYVHNNNIINNYHYGSGIIVTGGDLICEYNIIDHNNSDSGTGAAIAQVGGAYRVPHIVINNNLIKNNRSNGGAIFGVRGFFLVEKNIIINNSTNGLFNDGGGGGIFAYPVYNDTLIIRSNIIVGNTSKTFGGGISTIAQGYYPGRIFLIQRNVIAYNTACGKGGAIGIHDGSQIIVGGSPGKGNDIFYNIGKDSVNLFYHDLPSGQNTMNFQYNYLGNHPEKYHLYSQPDSLFDISNYSDTMNICGVTYNCDSLFDSLGFLTGIKESPRLIFNDDFVLYRNYPNPFNPTTSFRYGLLKPALVQVVIYDILGREVRELLREQQNTGVYELHWDGTNQQGAPVSSGVYLYRFTIGKQTSAGKMILNR